MKTENQILEDSIGEQQAGNQALFPDPRTTSQQDVLRLLNNNQGYQA